MNKDRQAAVKIKNRKMEKISKYKMNPDNF